MSPLITANQLEEIMNSGEEVLLCDCRFDLVDPLIGKKSYEESHLPGAIYVDLDKDLSGKKMAPMGDILFQVLRLGRKLKSVLG